MTTGTGILPRITGLASMALAAVLLTACGNETERADGSTVLRQAVGTMIAQAGVGRPDTTAAPARSADQIAASAMRANPGPLILATVESAGTAQAMALIGQNGTRRTFATPNQQALVFDGGILIATRGLGNDLNAADTAPVAALIKDRRAGQAQRVNYYLTGEGVERALPVTCSVAPGAAQSFAFAGRNWSARQIAETCSGHGASFTNNYLVDDGGNVVLSRQWIGPAMGYVTVQTIRP